MHSHVAKVYRLVMKATLAVITPLPCSIQGCALENLRQNSILYLNPASWAVRGPNSPCFLPCSKPSSARDPSLELISSLSARVVTKFEITQQQTPCWPYHQAKVEQHQKQVSVHAELNQSNFDRYHMSHGYVSRLCLTPGGVTSSHQRASIYE